MSEPLLYFRDEIAVGTDFRNRLHRLCGAQPQGKRVVVAARTIRHEPADYQLRIGPGSPGEPDLTGLDLVLVADSYAAPQGSINADGFSGQPGASGVRGADGKDLRNKNATSGTPGAPATPATPALGAVTVVALDYALGPVTARGGDGAKGGDGGDGGNAKPGTKSGQFGPTTPPGRSGNGGAGGNGSSGGAGGPVRLASVNGVPSGSSTGGIAGPGGAGGRGGNRSSTGTGPQDPDLAVEPGADGAAGASGLPGAAGLVEVLALTAPMDGDPGTYWPHVVQVLGPETAARWAEWRTKVAEYRFRSHPGAGPGALDATYSECVAALRLNPSATRATTLVRHLATSTTVLGISRTEWIPPTFQAYQDNAVQFQALVNGPVGNIVTLIGAVGNVAQYVQSIQGQLTSLEGQRQALAADVTAAQAAVQAAMARESREKNRLQQAEARAKALQSELSVARMEIQEGADWKDIGTVFEVLMAVVKTAAGFYSGDYALIVGGVSQLMAVATEDGEGIKVDDITKAVEVATKDGNVEKWLKANDFYVPSAETVEQIENAGKGLGELLEQTATFVNKKKALAQATTARYKDLDAKYTTLVREMILYVDDVRAASFDVVRARIGSDAATSRAEANERAISVLKNATLTNVTQIRETGAVLRSLLDTTRLYQDKVNRYVFMAARAADEWTFDDVADDVPMNLGWADPDLEEQAFFDLEYPVGAGADGDPTQVVHYATLVANGWGAVPQMNYQPGYEAYDQRLSNGSVFVRFDDAATLEALRTGLTVELDVDLGVVATSRAEIKTTRIAVGLHGAEANVPTVECLLTHAGTMVNRRADKSVVDQRAPRTEPTILNARTVDLTQADPTADVRQQFWGRSPFTTWTLEIEPGVAQQTALDMSNLKQIVIRIDYSALVVS